jgi:hypothetical protein
MNIAALPKRIPNKEIESEIRFNPTVNHQTRKNGLSRLNIIPLRIGLSWIEYFVIIRIRLFRLLVLLFLMVIMARICSMEKHMIAMPPTTPINFRPALCPKLAAEK